MSPRKHTFVMLLLLAVALLLLLLGCRRSALALATPTASVAVAVNEASPTPTATPVPSVTPPIRNVAPKAQPTPDTLAILKAEVLKQPSLQRSQWNNAKIKPSFEIAVKKAVMLYLRTRTRYEAVERMRKDGVPAPVLFCLHMRESDNSFLCHPHEGSSLLHRTRYVPKGRLPPPAEPPYKWEQSAEDAYYVADRLQGPWNNLPWAFNAMERFNGMGYQKRGKPSPYVWSGTQYYDAGKFVADGHYDSRFVDKQLGCIAVLKEMQRQGVEIAFDQ